MSADYLNPHAPGCPWYPAAELLGAPNIKWCEATLCQWISEPANTWSNLLYMVFAIVAWQQSRDSSDYELRWMGPGMFIMGLLSLVYHASNNYLSQIGDFIGMYMFVFWLMVINFRRAGWIRRDSQIKVFIAASVGCTILIHAMYLTGLKFQLIIAAAVGLIIVSEIVARRRTPDNRGHTGYYLTGLAFVAAAQTASLLDVTRTWCDPDNHLIQGHAAWHILAAIGLYFAFLHYRALRYEDPDTPVTA